MKLRSFSALVVVCLLFAPAAIAAEHGILLHASFANAKEKQRQPKPKRSRFVEPDFAALAVPPGLRRNERRRIERRLTAALFDDTVLHIELHGVERNAVDAYVWSGTIEGDDSSSVNIVVKDRVMVASVSTLSRRYMIEPVENGAHESFEIDPAAFPKESEPLTASAAAPARLVESSVAPVIEVADSGATIDVLVVYTDDLRAALGGTAAAHAAASNAIAATNTAYENSGVVPRVRLVGTAEVQYNEAGDLSAAVNALRSTSDGVMDEVHALRNQLGADDVSLLVVNGGQSCGTAFTLSQTFIDNPQFNFAGNAFNVVDNDCAVGNLSFPHELGHNFGLAHDRFVSPNATPSRPYAFGFVDTQGQFRDIMAYPDACNFCPRIQFFSSPSLSFLGRPLGVSFESSPSTSAENVRALNNNASIIANWRQSVAAPPTPTFTDNPLVAGTTPVKALHITELRTAIDDYREFAGLTTFAWSTNVAVDAPIAAAQIAELRSALEPALVAEGRTATFANPLAADDAIAAIDVQELRDLLSSD